MIGEIGINQECRGVQMADGRAKESSAGIIGCLRGYTKLKLVLPLVLLIVLQ